MTTQQARAFGSTRETSVEIAEAILDLAGGEETEAQHIWAEPTEDEIIAVERVAFAMTDEDTLFWGVETVRRSDVPQA